MHFLNPKPYSLKILNFLLAIVYKEYIYNFYLSGYSGKNNQPCKYCNTKFTILKWIE